ncbi:MAG: type II toxin-antitoxin system RelE/ParE family toxin [bacterium]|nr:type II toxin-antitoxin system RelE/ParE family toxin [bacterium]
MKKTVIFYHKPDGICPVQEFLDSLPGKAAQKVAWTLSLLEELDFIPSSYFKKLVGTEEIWECRVQFGSNAFRIFCFFDKGSLVVLTHGLIKKSQKTPQMEIKKAESYRKDYISRRGKQ